MCVSVMSVSVCALRVFAFRKCVLSDARQKVEKKNIGPYLECLCDVSLHVRVCLHF